MFLDSIPDFFEFVLLVIYFERNWFFIFFKVLLDFVGQGLRRVYFDLFIWGFRVLELVGPIVYRVKVTEDPFQFVFWAQIALKIVLNFFRLFSFKSLLLYDYSLLELFRVPNQWVIFLSASLRAAHKTYFFFSLQSSELFRRISLPYLLVKLIIFVHRNYCCDHVDQSGVHHQIEDLPNYEQCYRPRCVMPLPQWYHNNNSWYDLDNQGPCTHTLHHLFILIFISVPFAIFLEHFPKDQC